jgi:hypothetical protein
MKNNSECIFEVIGNEPVVDQFDVLYPSLLQGCVYDNYVTGSMISKVKIGPATIYLPGKRGLRFSKIGVGENVFPESKTVGTATSYELQKWRERCGTSRILRISSQFERYYDSMTPNLTKTIKALGGHIVKGTVAGDGFIYITAVPATVFAGETYGLTQSFPFEPKFAEIQRNKKIKEMLFADLTGTAVKVTPPVKVTNLGILEFDSNISYTAEWANDVGGFNKLDNFDLSKILFGYGDRRNTSVVSSSTRGRKNITDARRKDSSPIQLVSPVVRGWRYGLVSALPCYSSAVFRRDRYGQFRDMLEQRQDSRFIFDETSSPLYNSHPEEKIAMPYTSYGNSINKIIAFTSQPVVQVSFVEKKIVNRKLVFMGVEPKDTWSSNLSTYATSSLPFFDAEDSEGGRNRAKPNTKLLKSSVALSLSSDVFGNISAG